MRTLLFEPASKRFERLYWVLVMSPLAMQTNELVLQTDLLRNFHAIGHVKRAVDALGVPRDHLADEVRFYITHTGGSIRVNGTEYEYLKKHAQACVQIIHKSIADELRDVIECLNALKEEPEVTAKAPDATATAAGA